jgi:hypothetical protein
VSELTDEQLSAFHSIFSANGIHLTDERLRSYVRGCKGALGAKAYEVLAAWCSVGYPATFEIFPQFLALRARLAGIDSILARYADHPIGREIAKEIAGEDLKGTDERLLKFVQHVFAVQVTGTYFICGESGEKDSNDLPENIFVCPEYGCKWAAVYSKGDKVPMSKWTMAPDWTAIGGTSANRG